jgi:hypothetical protein
MTKYDLRKSYQEKATVAGGTLYRFGAIVQVWWNVLGGEVLDTPEPETWSAPSVEQAQQNFDSMKERWA